MVKEGGVIYNEGMKKLSDRLRLIWLAITITFLACLFIFLEPDELRLFVLSAGVYAPIVFVLLKMLTIVVAPLTGSPLYLLAGTFFGFWPGLAYIVLGDFLGYSTAFMISRLLGYERVRQFVAENSDSVLARTIENVGTTKGLFRLALGGFAFAEVVSYSAGLSRISYRNFIAVILPISAIISSFFIYLGSKLGDFTNYFWLNVILIPAILLVIVTELSIFVRSVKNPKHV